MSSRAVFLDRDGVINRNRRDHVKGWHEFLFLPGSLKAIRLLSQTDFRIFVLTNQAVINRGIVAQEELDAMHYQLRQAVAQSGGRIDDILYCPHRPEERCDCRKPRPGLLLRAAQEHGLDLAQSYLVGDAISDIAAGHAAGCKTRLVLSGRGLRQFLSRQARQVPHYHVALNLGSAVHWILRQERISPSTGSLKDFVRRLFLRI